MYDWSLMKGFLCLPLTVFSLVLWLSFLSDDQQIVGPNTGAFVFEKRIEEVRTSLLTNQKISSWWRDMELYYFTYQSED